MKFTAAFIDNLLHFSSILLCPFQMSEKRFKPAAMLFVFTVSAVVHEYILAVCFGFFYPVLFCLFMCFGSKNLYQVFGLKCRQTHKILHHCFVSSIYLHLHYSCSDVQLHFARPEERSHLEHNHVDVSLPGSWSNHLSVLPGVVRPAVLPHKGGNVTVYCLAKYSMLYCGCCICVIQ